MLVKILCTCGTKYSFDVDPVNGRMPAAVACPSCQTDGTEAANEFLRHAASVAPPAVRVAPPAVAAAAPPSPVPPMAAPSPITPPPARAAGGTAKKRGYGEPNLLLGTLGAAGGAFIGMMIWFGIIYGTNTEVGIIAWAVGGITGFGCRVLGAGYSQKLGLIAAACAFVAIVGGEYLATRSAFHKVLAGALEGAYDSRMTYAQEAVKLESDAQIRTFLAAQESEDDTKVDPESITAEDLKNFRERELPELKEFVKGRPSKTEYERDITAKITSALQGLIWKESLSLWTFLWLFLGVGSAYRLGTGETQ